MPIVDDLSHTASRKDNCKAFFAALLKRGRDGLLPVPASASGPKVPSTCAMTVGSSSTTRTVVLAPWQGWRLGRDGGAARGWDKAQRISRSAPGDLRRESLFETVMDPLVHAAEPPRFVF